MKEDLIYILAQFLAVAVVLTFHEFAHAYAAYKNGDPTAKFAGRLTLNPVKHFDALGVFMFAIAGFGWAKPVPVNPANFNNYRKGCFWTSVAGVLINYVMAFLLYPVFVLVVYKVCPLFDGKYMEYFLYVFFYSLFACSLSFCVFNLLPFYPLDGFRIVDAVSTRRGRVYQFLRTNGHYVLLGLIFVHIFAGRFSVLAHIDVLGYVLDFAIKIFGRPITMLWNWALQPIING